MSDDAERDHYSLPEQRHQVTVGFGGISSWHVVHRSTIRSGKHEGRWTRRACDRRTLCGGMSAGVVGIDAAEWATEMQPLSKGDLERVNCDRCRKRYERLFPST